LWTFYDIAKDPSTLQTVPPNSYKKTLASYLADTNTIAAVINFGVPGPILLASGLLDKADVRYTLVHEVLIHSYKAKTDRNVLDNTWFQQKGLWDDHKGSTTITTWLSTDCRCTPGAPGAAGKDPRTGDPCQAGNPKW
jgi:hypothetical protein